MQHVIVPNDVALLFQCNFKGTVQHFGDFTNCLNPEHWIDGLCAETNWFYYLPVFISIFMRSTSYPSVFVGNQMHTKKWFPFWSFVWLLLKQSLYTHLLHMHIGEWSLMKLHCCSLSKLQISKHQGLIVKRTYWLIRIQWLWQLALKMLNCPFKIFSLTVMFFFFFNLLLGWCETPET